MFSLRDLSIKHKLTFLVLATSAAALLLACVVFAAYDLISFRHSLVDRLHVQAEIIGANSTAALTFDDPRAADEILGAGKADPRIVSACIFAKDRRRFATYLRGDAFENVLPSGPEAEGYRFGKDRLEMFHSIILDREPIGTVYLRSDLEELQARLQRFAMIVAIVMVGACLVAFLLSARLQRAISEPILHLAETARVVSIEKNYSARAIKRSQDEIGLLIDAFNDMLTQIQARDGALRKAHDELEDRVRERTHELQQEITERARVEEELRDSENTLRTMAAAAHDAVIMMDSDGRISFWNDAAAEIFGYTRDEALQQQLHTLVVPERYYEAYRKGFARFRETGTGAAVGKTSQLVALRKGGHEFPVELAISAVKLKGRWHAVGITRDITERKWAEAETQEARSVAEAATRAKSEFLANMSHEIRTPMNAVVGMTGLLLDTNLTAEQLDYVKTIRSSSDALLTIINDILDFSKIESGRLELENQPFELRDCIEESLDLLAPNAAEKDLDLAYLIAEGTPTMLVGDITRLRQILVNLLSNAVKFTDRGEAVVGVEAQCTTPDRCELHFTVRDTGIGIRPERMDRLFQSFSQVDASTTRRYGGTGLGLAISKRLAELMGGTMWVDSTLGEGSTFHFTIVPDVIPSRPHAYLRSAPQLNGKHLLIVDDNATYRRLLTQYAQSWGMLPRAAGSAVEALAWIRDEVPFDAAILDARIPEMSGAALATEIRRHRDAQRLPVILMTVVGRREEETAQPVQFAAALTKPIKPAQLFNALINVFDVLSVRGAEPAPRMTIDRRMAERFPLRILVAEDNAVNQKVVLRILERMGYGAEVAANGLEVLDALRRRPYDVVFMDVQMPEMDGLEATRCIREQWSANEQPRIVAMTAHAMAGDREKCLAAGMDDYVSKPLEVKEIAAALERCASRPPAVTAAAG